MAVHVGTVGQRHDCTGLGIHEMGEASSGMEVGAECRSVADNGMAYTTDERYMGTAWDGTGHLELVDAEGSKQVGA